MTEMAFCCGAFANSWIVAVKVNQPPRSFGPAAQWHGQAVPNRMQQCCHPCILARFDQRHPGRSAADLQLYAPCCIARRRDHYRWLIRDHQTHSVDRCQQLVAPSRFHVAERPYAFAGKARIIPDQTPSRQADQVAHQCFYGVGHWCPVRVPMPALAAARYALHLATNGSMISRSAVDNQRMLLNPFEALSSDALAVSFVASP